MFRVARLFPLLEVRNRDAAATPTDSTTDEARAARPDRAGRWELLRADGSRLVCRVVDRNGQFYAIRPGCFSAAVPVDQFDGTWRPLDRG